MRPWSAVLLVPTIGGSLCGLLVYSLAPEAEGHGAETFVSATDIATSPVLTVTPDDDLHTALRRFTQKNIDEIPVVEDGQSRRVGGNTGRS